VQTVTHAHGGTVSTSGYGYDAEGNLSPVITGGVTHTNIYDASGNLLLQSDPTTGTTLYLGDTELHMAPGATTASGVRTYSTPDGTPVAERTATAGGTGSTLYWVGADLQNTQTVEVNAATGAVSTRYTDPYGNARGVEPGWSSDHTFLNAPTSALTSLVNLGARMYDSTIGKFLSADPILDPGNPQQVNGYSYASNNPVTMDDPTGAYASDMYGGSVAYDQSANNNGGTQGRTQTPPAAAGNSSHAQHRPSFQQSATNKAACGRFGACSNHTGTAKQIAHDNQVAWGLTATVGFAAATIGALVLSGGLDAFFLPEELAGETAAVEGIDGAGLVSETTARLSSHVGQAVQDYADGTIGMSRAQVAAVARNPGLEPAFRGQVIDSAAKNAVRADTDLAHLWVARSGEFGPDFFDLDSNNWWDITTQGEFQNHLDQYTDPFGTGIGLFTK
jgi:RHS repeat-associated protein